MFCDLEVALSYFSKQCGHTWGSFGVKVWFRFRVRASVSGKFGDPYNTNKFLDLPFSKEVPHEMVSPETSLWKVDFYRCAMLVFWLSPFLVAGMGLPRHFGVWKAVLRDMRWTSENCSFAWYFVHIAKALGARFQIRGGFGGHFSWQVEYLLNLVWNCRGFWFGTWSPFCVAGAILRMPPAHFSWRSQYFRDFDEKMAAAYFHIFTVHVSWRPQYLVKI